MVVVWIVLVLVAMLVLGASFWRLVTAFVALLEAFGMLAAKPAILDGVHRADAEPREHPAVLQPRGEISARWAAVSYARRDRRDTRRAARLARAHDITHVDVTSREWFTK